MQNRTENEVVRNAGRAWKASRGQRAMPSLHSSRCLLALLFLLCALDFSSAVQPPVAGSAATPSSDMLLLEQESKFQREKTQYLQENILDKILGPGKAVVIVEVEMNLESRDTQMGME